MAQHPCHDQKMNSYLSFSWLVYRSTSLVGRSRKEVGYLPMPDFLQRSRQQLPECQISYILYVIHL